MSVDGNVFYLAEEERREREWEESRPRCDWCGEKIYDDTAYRIGDDLVCRECIGDCVESID